VRIPGSWLEGRVQDDASKGLPKRLYDMPSPAEQGEDKKDGDILMIDTEKPKSEKQKWGPDLVDQRPSRQQRDGRTVLERAHER
jgi:hypothetical protein